MIKTLKKLRLEGTFLNIMKAVYNKPIANIKLNGEKLKLFPLKIRNKARLSTLPSLIQYTIVIPSQSKKTGERNTGDSNK
jgi:hypothetical protein